MTALFSIDKTFSYGVKRFVNFDHNFAVKYAWYQLTTNQHEMETILTDLSNFKKNFWILTEGILKFWVFGLDNIFPKFYILNKHTYFGRCVNSILDTALVQ